MKEDILSSPSMISCLSFAAALRLRVILWRSDAEKPASFAEEWNAKKSSGDS